MFCQSFANEAMVPRCRWLHLVQSKLPGHPGYFSTQSATSHTVMNVPALASGFWLRLYMQGSELRSHSRGQNAITHTYSHTHTIRIFMADSDLRRAWIMIKLLFNLIQTDVLPHSQSDDWLNGEERKNSLIKISPLILHSYVHSLWQLCKWVDLVSECCYFKSFEMESGC